MLSHELHNGPASFVIVDRSEARVAEARALHYLCVQGEATDEVVLRQAGVARARVLATVLPDDAANVFITLSARSLNKSLHIIARGEVPTTEGKLLHAGADEVVLPTHIGAERMAELILYPGAAELIRNKERARGTLTRPPANTKIEPGDGVVLIGRSGRVADLKGFASA